MIKNKKILITGGTGFLGTKLTEKYVNDNEIFIYSRDESKHSTSRLYFNNNKNINYIIGDVRDKDKVKQILLRIKPDIIILAAAMKHIEKCEAESDQCISINITGTQNFLNLIENNIHLLTNLKNVLFISTDKACSPLNIYGMSKAISECLMIEKSNYIKDIKFNCCRYGNVLGSTSSILPVLHSLGKNPDVKQFTITDKNMTRFVMTIDDSVDLIEYTILYGENGDVIIPKLISCNIIDLFEIFSELYNKPVIYGELRPGEKILESLINETQSRRLVIDKTGYMHIKPYYTKEHIIDNDFVKDYNSKINPISKEELKEYLIKLNYL